MGLGKVPYLTPEAEQELLSHSWPGNVRELRNVIERTVLLSSRPEIGPSDLVLAPYLAGHQAKAQGSRAPRSLPATPGRRPGTDGERERILEALNQCQWNQTRSA